MNEIKQVTAKVISDGSVSVTYYGIQDVRDWKLAYYRLERVAVKITSTKAVTLDMWFASEVGLTYQLTAGTIVVELTELIPIAMRDMRSITFNAYTADGKVSEEIEIGIATVGAENRENVLIPYNQANDGDVIYQVPPHAIYVPQSETVTVGFELGVLSDFVWCGSAKSALTKSQCYALDYQVAAGDTLTMKKSVLDSNAWWTQVQAIPCGVESKAVEWSSRLGGYKKAYWFVKDMTEEVTESQDIQVKPNVNTLRFGVDVRKNYRETMTLYLPNLDAYDTYYYADLITSDSVSIDGRTVRVLSSTITYPNGSDRGSVEVTIEFTTHNTILV